MAEMFIVYFEVNGEPTDAKFEFRENAIELAEMVADAGFDAHVVDHFGVTTDYSRKNVIIHPPEAVESDDV